MPADIDVAQKVAHGSDWSSRCQPTLMWHRRLPMEVTGAGDGGGYE